MKKSYILLLLLVSITMLMSSCANPIYESESDLNRVFNDRFTFISRNKIEKNLYSTEYSTETLGKNVTVLSKGNQQNTSHYTNYDALKYENDSKERLAAELKKLMYLQDNEFEISFDCRFYTTAYEDLSAESLYRSRLIWKEGDPGTAPNVINEETVSITIKESAVTIRKEKYVKSVENSLKEINLSSKFKIIFVNAEGGKIDEYDYKN